MPWIIQQLLRRGYFEEAGEGSEGSAGEASGADTQADNTSSDVDESSDSKQSKSKISESEAKLLKEVMVKKAKIKELENDLNTFKSQLTQFDGIDPVQIKSLLQERADAEKAKLEAKGEWTALKDKMAKEHMAEKEALLKQIEEVRNQHTQSQSIIEKLTLTHQFDTSNFISNDLVLTPRKAKAVYGGHFDIDETGRVVGYDKPRGESNRTPLVDGQGEPLNFDEAMKRLIEADPDRDELLKAKRRPGAASSSGATGKATETPRRMSSYEKIEEGLKAMKKS